jgi:hypothetical protein
MVEEMRVFKFKDLCFDHLTVDTVDKTTDASPLLPLCDPTPSFLGFLGLNGRKCVRAGSQIMVLASKSF